MRHVLVTGSTGFIGNYVIQQLLREGYTVTATSANEQKARSFSWINEVSYIPFQLDQFRKEINYYDYFGRPDLLIHLAWEGLPNYRSGFHIEENLPRHKALLQNLIANGLTDVAVTGTCFEYGMQDGLLIETMESRPANPYALAKDELRKYLLALGAQHSFHFKWIRLFYMYGKGQGANSLMAQLEKALDNGDEVFNMSGGAQVRDFLPVEKMAEYIVSIALQQKVQGIINCCSGEPVTVRQLVEAYLHNNKKYIKLNLGYYPYPDYEPMQFWGDNSQLKSIVENE